METFITLYFWILALAIGSRIGLIGMGHYPHTSTETLGGAIAKVLVGMPVMLWAGWLLWG